MVPPRLNGCTVYGLLRKCMFKAQFIMSCARPMPTDSPHTKWSNPRNTPKVNPSRCPLISILTPPEALEMNFYKLLCTEVHEHIGHRGIRDLVRTLQWQYLNSSMAYPTYGSRTLRILR